MIYMRANADHFLTRHGIMAEAMEREALVAAERSKDLLVASIREDLAKKILRPRESDGALSEAIDGEVIRAEGDIIIGIGNMERMDAKVPYWYLQDQGGPIAVKAVPGYFVNMAGQRVIFDPARAPIAKSGPSGLVVGKQSSDLFIYNKGAGSIMWIKADIKPKRYFEAGELDARMQVLREFEAALRRAFR